MIRRSERKDLKQVMEIWLESNIQAHPFVPETYWQDNYSMVQEMISRAEVYVCESSSGRICGFAGLMEDYIAGIFVREEFRSAGIGKALLDYVKERHESLSLSVYRKNQRAAAFYEREGFAVCEEGVDPDTGEEELAMEWKRGAL